MSGCKDDPNVMIVGMVRHDVFFFLFFSCRCFPFRSSWISGPTGHNWFLLGCSVGSVVDGLGGLDGLSTWGWYRAVKSRTDTAFLG